MSMHISVVSIKGDRLNEVADVLRQCRYAIENSFTVMSGEQALLELDWNPDRNRVAKVAFVVDDWTFIVDPELVLMSDDVWLKYSYNWRTRIVAWLCEGASGSYGLSVFESGSKRREVFSVEGEVLVDRGAPLPEELNMKWSEVSEDDVLEIAKRLGADFEFLDDCQYQVFQLDESQLSNPGILE